METSSLVTVRLNDIHNGVMHMDSSARNGRRAVPGERATLTLMSSYILQDVSWALSPPESWRTSAQRMRRERVSLSGPPRSGISQVLLELLPNPTSQDFSFMITQVREVGSELPQWSTVHNQLSECGWKEKIDSSKVTGAWL